MQGRTGGEPKPPLARGSERAGRASQPCLELATREHCSSCAVIQTQYSLLLDAAAQSLLDKQQDLESQIKKRTRQIA